MPKGFVSLTVAVQSMYGNSNNTCVHARMHVYLLLISNICFFFFRYHSPYPNDKARVADVSILLLAGHETTSFQLSWLTIELARRPYIVTKIRAEIASVLGPSGATPLTCTPSQLIQLTYLGDVIKEGMRLWPVAAAATSREAPRDLLHNGMIIPKGKDLIKIIRQQRNH